MDMTDKTRRPLVVGWAGVTEEIRLRFVSRSTNEAMAAG